jgi:hypothetical protein
LGEDLRRDGDQVAIAFNSAAADLAGQDAVDVPVVDLYFGWRDLTGPRFRHPP